jgi:hypothetical protein
MIRALAVLAVLALAAGSAHAFVPTARPVGPLRLDCTRASGRFVKPAMRERRRTTPVLMTATWYLCQNIGERVTTGCVPVRCLAKHQGAMCFKKSAYARVHIRLCI